MVEEEIIGSCICIQGYRHNYVLEHKRLENKQSWRSIFPDLELDDNKKKIIQKLILNKQQIFLTSVNKNILPLEKLKSYKTFYRIRAGDYRIGIEIVNDKIIFTRFLHRKDIYKYFP